jgi:2-phospho-L-lactate guanylyltransferase
VNRAFPLFALVPVRPFAEGKRRLAPLLAPEERAALARAMLADALECLARTPAIEGIAVVSARAGESPRAYHEAPLSGDADAQAIAAEWRAATLPDSPGGLNASLTAACAWARVARPECAILILPADVPGAAPEDIAALAASGHDVTLVRSGDGGTNALLLRPGAGIPFAFGPQSCSRHEDLARAGGLTVGLVARKGLELDLDRPEDVARYLARAGASRTLGLLHRLGVPARLPKKVSP